MADAKPKGGNKNRKAQGGLARNKAKNKLSRARKASGTAEK